MLFNEETFSSGSVIINSQYVNTSIDPEVKIRGNLIIPLQLRHISMITIVGISITFLYFSTSSAFHKCDS